MYHDDRVLVLFVVDFLGFGKFLATAQLVVAKVGRDPVDPGREVEDVVDPMDGSQDLEERLLGQVLGQLPVPQYAEGQAVDGLVVALEKRVEGGDSAVERIANGVEVR